MSARNMAKRTAAGTLALAVCLGGGALALAGAAQADANFKFDTRIAGDDRYQTAIAASKAAFPTDGKTDNVVLVNGFATVDGLTASYLAGVANAPILYVSDKGADDATKAEIKRLGAKNVWLVGGTTVIPTSVETAIKGDGYNVTRINGSDRYETAKLIAEAGAKIAGKQPSKVFVASGTSFADALAVSPVAYAKGYAIALTEKDSTSDYTKKELGNIGTDAKILVGGTAVVSDKVKADLSITTRVAGDDRAVTANLVSDWAKKSEGFNPANAALVGGTNGNGADSLVASALGAKSFTTLHFAGWDATTTYLKDHSAELTGKGFVFGGKAAVPGDQVDKAQAAAQSPAASNQSYSIAGASGSKVVSLGADDLTTDADERIQGNVQYKITGLGDTAVNVALVSPDAIATDGGKVTFLSAGTIGQADLTAASAGFISVVNGVATGTTNTTASNITPVDGAVSITVNSTAPGDLIPVVFSNADKNTVLELDSTTVGAKIFGSPKGKFGIGSKLSYTAAAAKTGTYSASTNTNTDGVRSELTVTSVDSASKTFQATYTVGVSGSSYTSAAGTFKYGVAGSSYYAVSGGTQLSDDQFAAFISKGDVVTTTYNASGPSTYTFATNGDRPAAPTKVAAAVADQNSDGTPDSIKVTFTAAPNLSATGYTLQRAVVSKDGVVGSWGNVTGATVTSAQAKEFYDTSGVAGETYQYRVFTTPGSASTTQSDATSTVTFPKSAVVGGVSGAPTITDVRIDDQQFSASGSAAFKVGPGDEFQILFNEPVVLPVGSAFRINDGVNSATVTLDGTNAEAVALAAGTYEGKTIVAGQGYRVRILTALTDPSPSASTVAMPAKITAITSGVVDLDEGKAVSLASGDVTIDSVANLDVTYGAPTTAAGAYTAADRTVKFTSDVPLAASELATGDFALAAGTGASVSGNSVTAVALSADGKTITITLAATLATGNTVTLDKTAIKSFDGVAGTGTTVKTI